MNILNLRIQTNLVNRSIPKNVGFQINLEKMEMNNVSTVIIV